MNRDQIAHEYALKLIDHDNQPRTIDDITKISFDLADAMIKEANKRKEVGFPLDSNEVK